MATAVGTTPLVAAATPVAGAREVDVLSRIFSDLKSRYDAAESLG